MNARKPKIFLLLAIILLLSLITAYADPPAEPTDSGNNGLILDIFIGIVKAIAEVVLGFIGSIIAAQLNVLLEAYKFMILWNPNPFDLRYITEQIIGLFVPVYVIALIVIGIYFIFVSTDPASRARAKDNLMKLIFSMVLITLSLEIYSIFLDVSLALSKAVLSGVYIEGNNVAIGAFGLVSLASGSVVPIVFLLVLVVAGASVALRHVMVYFMAVLFPLTIFLYFFDYTREAGSKLLKHTFMSIFTQVVQAFILAVTVAAMNSAGTTGLLDNTSSSFLCIFVSMGGFVMLAVAPLIMLGVMEWIGAAAAMAGSVLSFVPGMQVAGAILTAAGNVAAGMGPGGLIAGGTAYGLGSSFNSTFNQGGGGGQQTLTQRPKQAVLAEEKKDRQTDMHKQMAQGKSRDDVMADRNSQKYSKDNAQNLGSFFDRAETDNAPKPPPPKPPSAPVYQTAKNVGLTLAKAAFSPAISIYRGAKGIGEVSKPVVDNVKQGSKEVVDEVKHGSRSVVDNARQRWNKVKSETGGSK
jgi:hypothetical protein